MFLEKKAVATAVTLTLGTLGLVGAVSADSQTLTFINNDTETLATEAGTVATFGVDSEFHFATQSGKKNDTDKDIMFGGEQWLFDGASGAMTGVSGFGLNSGADSTTSGGTPLTSGIAGFPVAGAAGTHDIIGQGADLLEVGDFTFLAPTTTSEAGSVYGPAVISGLSEGVAGSFEVFFSVLNMQWVGGSYIIGGDDGLGTVCSITDGCAGPGVTFLGTTDGAGNFTLSARQTMTRNEVTVGGFANQSVEFALRGTYGHAAVPVPAAVWLFGSGLMGMVGVARRRNKA